MNKNIVIVGAGSAGWLTALFIKKLFPHKNVTVIGSSEIGILGAGEGTVPGFIEFLNSIDVSIVDIIKNCKGSIKNGVKFVNWNGTDDVYYHPFSSVPKLDKTYFDSKFTFFSKQQTDFSLLSFVCEDKDINQLNLCSLNMEQKKVPFVLSEQGINGVAGFALHFDANLVASYLKSVAESRGIIYIDDIISGFKQNENGSVTAIQTNSQNIECDFVFDCSGFKRLLIGNLYKTEWKSVGDRLPVKRALPFFLPPDEQVECYTTATAMKNGWVWKIPLQHRSGCGYIFDSDYCTDDEATQEIESKFGKVEIPRSFNFNAGHYEKYWVKNCIAIGLSSGFLEPMEATSIWTSTFMLNQLVNYTHAMFVEDDVLIKEFNENCSEVFEQTTDFLQLHYLTQRNDSQFWREYKQKHSISEKLSNMMQLWDRRFPQESECRVKAGSFWFTSISWVYIMQGTRNFNVKNLIDYKNSLQHLYPDYETKFENLKDILYNYNEKCLTHNEFIKNCVNGEVN
jgi:tryptophan 7-halogenase